MNADFKDYLGDGLYVDYDGFQIILSTDRSGETHWVALDLYTLQALDRYRERIKQHEQNETGKYPQKEE